MKQKTTRGTLRVFYLYLLSMIAIPLVAGVGLYAWSIARYREDLESEIGTVLQLNQRVLERELADLELFFSRIGSLEPIRPFAAIADQTLRRRDLLTILELRQALSENYTKEGLLHSVFVFNTDAGVMVSDSPVFFFPGDYGDERRVPVYFQLADHSYEEWVSFVKAGSDVTIHPSEWVTINGAVEELIPITTKTRVPGDSTWVVAFLDIDRLLAPFSELPWYDDGWFAFGVSDRIIASTGEAPISADAVMRRVAVSSERRTEFAVDERLVTVIKSFRTGNFFVSSLPYSVILSGLTTLRIVAVGTMAAVILLGFLMGRLISAHLSRPILNLYEIVAGISGASVDYFHDFERLGDYYQEIRDEKQQLSQSVVEIQRYLTNSFFDLVLDSEITSRAELDEVMRFVQYPYREHDHLIFSCFILGLPARASETELPQLVGFRQVIGQVFRQHNVIYRREENSSLHVGVIPLRRGAEPRDRSAVNRRLLSIITELREGYDIDSSCAATEPSSDVLELSSRYREVQEASGHLGVYTKEKVLWFADIPQHSLLYYYPIEWEQSIINSIAVGDGTKSREILESIWTENFENRDLSSVMIDRMIADLHGTVFKVVTLVNRQREIVDAARVNESLERTPGSYREAFGQITQVLSQIQRSVKDYKSSHSQLLDRVTRYLDQHFSDPNLTMDQVADESGITKPYLSRFFKEKMGINFNQYLLDLRMQKAKDLLRDGEATVGEIARLAGFGSVRSFNRGFKQSTGISPREFQRASLDGRSPRGAEAESEPSSQR